MGLRFDGRCCVCRERIRPGGVGEGDPIWAKAGPAEGVGHTIAHASYVTVESECGHPQAPPTVEEIAGCPEIIVRRCPECARELYWWIDRWRLV